MKHIHYYFILLAAFMGVAHGAWAEDIHITTIDQLNTVAMNVLAGNSYSGDVIYLDNDLEFDGTANNFTPIGCVSGNSKPFAGTFDGQGHTISGLNLLGESRRGLFGLVTTGTVRNLTVSNSRFSSTNSSSAGIVVNLNGGTVSNCHVTADVHVRKGVSGIGGIVARCESGSIIDCTSAALVGEEEEENSGIYVGGILGYSEHTAGDVSVQNCLYYSTQNSLRNTKFKGAIVGNINDGTSYSTTLQQNFYYTTQAAIKGVGYKEKEPSEAPGTPEYNIDVAVDHGAVCTHIVSAQADIDDMGVITVTRDNGITLYTNGIKFKDVYYSHILALENNGNYSGDALAAYRGRTFDVKLRGRRFYRDGDWNTFCLPFDVPTAGTIFQGNGREIRELDIAEGYYVKDHDKDIKYYRKTGYREEDRKLYLFFKITYSPRAGTPYIVKWTQPDGYNPLDPACDFVNPVFADVTIDNISNPSVSEDGAVTFTPTYNPVVRDYQDRTLLLLGADNTLYYPQGNGTATINTFRAYFQLNNGLQMAADGGGGDDEEYIPEGGGDVKAFVVDLDFANQIRDVKNENAVGVQSLYDLSGRKVATPSRGTRLTALPSGVYIANGKKIFIR